MNKVAIIVGTRPEAIKLLPVYLSSVNISSIETTLISTGQHREMLEQIFSFFEVTPDINLDLMTHNQDLAQFAGKVFRDLGLILDRIKPNYLMVQGDTTTAMIASIIGFYKRIRVCHIEAGLRTNNLHNPFPEELNRRIISLAADIHFAPTELARNNLVREGIERVYVVGNTVIDSVLYSEKKISDSKMVYEKRFAYLNNFDKTILITCHRRENFGEILVEICEAIRELAMKFQEVGFVFPVHLNPNIRTTVFDKLEIVSNVRLIEPLPYDDMVYLMMQSDLILTDSGGIQEEAPSLNTPVLVMRETTERVEGIEAGTAKLCGTKKDSIFQAVIELLTNSVIKNRMIHADNPYGDGQTSKRIWDVLRDELVQ